MIIVIGVRKPNFEAFNPIFNQVRFSSQAAGFNILKITIFNMKKDGKGKDFLTVLRKSIFERRKTHRR